MDDLALTLVPAILKERQQTPTPTPTSALTSAPTSTPMITLLNRNTGVESTGLQLFDLINTLYKDYERESICKGSETQQLAESRAAIYPIGTSASIGAPHQFM
jgi:hypothetical protein